jgi:hypothetical protein
MDLRETGEGEGGEGADWINTACSCEPSSSITEENVVSIHVIVPLHEKILILLY